MIPMMAVEMDVKLEIEEDSQDSALKPVELNDEDPSKQTDNSFRVDVSLIPQAKSNDAGALNDLGLQVFNQSDLEAGVIAQAEQRMEERSQAIHAKRSVFSFNNFFIVPSID
jgi:hypothetical protein